MDILAALKAEELKLQQQLDTVHATMKIVKEESKASGRKKGAPDTQRTCKKILKTGFSSGHIKQIRKMKIGN
jgi:hypothetical protein